MNNKFRSQHSAPAPGSGHESVSPATVDRSDSLHSSSKEVPVETRKHGRLPRLRRGGWKLSRSHHSTFPENSAPPETSAAADETTTPERGLDQKADESATSHIVLSAPAVLHPDHPPIASPEDSADYHPEALETFTGSEKRQLGWYKQYNLRDRYQVSPRLIIRNAWQWAFLTIVVWTSFLFFFGWEALMEPLTFFEVVLYGAGRLSLAVFLLAALYWEVYRRTLDLRIVGFRLVSTSGVFWKLRRSLSIGPSLQVFIEQTPLDLALNVHCVQAWLAGTSKDQVFLVPALSKKDADDLYNYLTIELSRQVAVAGGALDVEDQLRFREALESQDDQFE